MTPEIDKKLASFGEAMINGANILAYRILCHADGLKYVTVDDLLDHFDYGRDMSAGVERRLKAMIEKGLFKRKDMFKGNNYHPAADGPRYAYSITAKGRKFVI